MEKPNVENPELASMLDKLYRPNARVGSGSTSDALRHERLTGEQVGGRNHMQKVSDSIKGLERWLEINKNIKATDISAAENVLKDLRNALQ